MHGLYNTVANLLPQYVMFIDKAYGYHSVGEGRDSCTKWGKNGSTETTHALTVKSEDLHSASCLDHAPF